jgi:hypothetical protein
MTMKCALAVSILIATVGIAQAQREGGAFFGPFAHGSSAGAATGPSGCVAGYITPCRQPSQAKKANVAKRRTR